MADNTLIDAVNKGTQNFLNYFRKDKPSPVGGSQSQANIDKQMPEDEYEVSPEGYISKKWMPVDEKGFTHPM